MRSAMSREAIVGGARSIWKFFRVFVRGSNFLLDFEGDSGTRRRKMGFYTTVFVRARNPNEAEMRAVATLRKDRSLVKSVRNPKTSPPRLHVEEIVEIESFRGVRTPRTGLAFYAEGARPRGEETSTIGRQQELLD